MGVEENSKYKYASDKFLYELALDTKRDELVRRFNECPSMNSIPRCRDCAWWGDQCRNAAVKVESGEDDIACPMLVWVEVGTREWVLRSWMKKPFPAEEPIAAEDVSGRE